VAGSFYPADRGELEQLLRRCFDDAEEPSDSVRSTDPRALIVPHAGYVYSGPVAASAYQLLRPLRPPVERVVLLGPSHRVAFEGVASSSARAFSTPLGEVALDRDAIARAEALPFVRCADGAHAQEHSLEVQLPFLQLVLGEFLLVPFSVGDASTEQIATLVDPFLDEAGTLVIVSSDLSHYYDYATAAEMDARTTRAIEACAGEELDFESACGRIPLRGLLECARRRGLRVHTLDLRNSGDTAGPRDQVVGYGAYLVG
jgi:AmmeMemoRadiSam system protein B